jgi:hypothetical protein
VAGGGAASQGETTFVDLCFRPLDLTGTASDCVIQSVAGYWQNNKETLNFNYCGRIPNRCANSTQSVIDHYTTCTSNPTSTGDLEMVDGCLPPFQDPIRPEVVIGGCATPPPPTAIVRENRHKRRVHGTVVHAPGQFVKKP